MNMLKQAARYKLYSVLFLICEHFVRRGLTLPEIARILRSIAHDIDA